MRKTSKTKTKAKADLVFLRCISVGQPFKRSSGVAHKNIKGQNTRRILQMDFFAPLHSALLSANTFELVKQKVGAFIYDFQLANWTLDPGCRYLRSLSQIYAFYSYPFTQAFSSPYICPIFFAKSKAPLFFEMMSQNDGSVRECKRSMLPPLEKCNLQKCRGCQKIVI